MNKKIVSALLLLPTVATFADNVNLDKVAIKRAEWAKRHFAAEGSPAPDGGVIVMPEKQMSQYKVFKAQREKERSDVQKYGYIKQFLPQVQTLINFKEVAKNQISLKTGNPASEGLRGNVNEIEMAYPFHGVPNHAVTTMLGASPSVTYIQGKGWAGAMQYFEKDGLGTCNYRENNLKFSHGSAIIASEDATKEVNGKITVTNIIGEPKSGFLYSVDWYDNNYFRELKCANAVYSSNTLSSVLELARQIDNNG